MSILLLFFACSALVALTSIGSMRFFASKFGLRKLYDDGIVVSENGIEYWGFLLTGIRKEPFSAIKSVELVPYFKVVVGILTFRYGLSARRVPFKPFNEILIIRLKSPNPIEYLFFSPANAASLVEQLKSRIGDY